MITTLSGRWLQITSNPPQYINQYSGYLNVGAVRYNPQLMKLEIYDGMNWQPYQNDSHIDLSPEAQATLDWARAKMLDEERIEALMEKHPGLRDLHDRFQVMLRLVQQDQAQQDV